MNAPINKIVPLSVVDGPGNRTAIFLQKCNLFCAYCHNPETQNHCNGCGVCVESCPVDALQRAEKEKYPLPLIWDSDKCVQCDNCIRKCPWFASPKICYRGANDVFREIKKNIPFIRGITVSGGECTLYPEFLSELFYLTKKAGLTCYIDSNGCVELSKHEHLMELCDKVMLDVKAWNQDVFFRLTGGNVDLVKKNLKYLAEKKKLEEVRIVCIEPEVDVKHIICGVSEMIRSHLDEISLKLIAYQNHGVRTKLANREPPSVEQMEEWKRMAEKKGFSHVRII